MIVFAGLAAAVAVGVVAPASAGPAEKAAPEEIKPLLVTAAEVKAATGIRVPTTEPECFVEQTFTSCQVIFKSSKPGLTVNGGSIQSYPTRDEALAKIKGITDGQYITKVIEKTPTRVVVLSIQPTATYYSMSQAVGSNVTTFACKKGKGTTTKEGFACVRSIVKAQVAKMR